MSDATSKRKIALIGSGPISLLKAYLIASKNPESEVLIFDMRGEFGGAWYSDKSPGGHEIECGCHIWSYNPEVYNYIESELGIKLDFFRPTPLFVSNKIKVPYSTKNFIDSYKFISKSLLTFRNPKLSSRPNVHGKLIGKRNKYPATGSPELIHALHEKLDSLPNVNFIKGVELLEIVIDSSLELRSDAETYQADEVFMTSVSKLQSVSKGDKKVHLNPQRIDYNHFLLTLNKPLNKAISYWRLMDDPVVHRITDITYQTNGKEDLLLVGIKPKPFEEMEQEQLMNHLTNLFRKLKLTDESHELSLIKSHCYPTYYSAPEARKEIAELDDRLHILHTTDLIYGMYYMLKEEEVI